MRNEAHLPPRPISTLCCATGHDYEAMNPESRPSRLRRKEGNRLSQSDRVKARQMTAKRRMGKLCSEFQIPLCIVNLFESGAPAVTAGRGRLFWSARRMILKAPRLLFKGQPALLCALDLLAFLGPKHNIKVLYLYETREVVLFLMTHNMCSVPPPLPKMGA